MSDYCYLIHEKTKVFLNVGDLDIQRLIKGPFTRSTFGIKIDRELATNYLPQGIRRFIESGSDDLFFLKGQGQEPWESSDEFSYIWKEYTGPLTVEFWLPRNLIEDAGIASWPEALNHLSKCEVHLLDEINIDAYKRAFTTHNNALKALTSFAGTGEAGPLA